MLGSIDERSSEAPLHFQARVYSVRSALQQHRISPDLQRRILTFFSYQHARCKGADELQLLRELPDLLHVDIMLHLFLSTVKRVPFFADAEEGFLAHLVKALRPRVCGPGEVLVEEGGIGEDMFFVLKGELLVLVSGMEVATLRTGAFFGEYAALMSTVRSASVISSTFCDFYILQQTDLRCAAFPAHTRPLAMCMAHLGFCACAAKYFDYSRQ